MTNRWERWSPLAGILAVAGMIIGFAVGGNNPDTKSSDTKITTYYASHSHQVRQIVAFFIFLAGILFLLWFLSILRTRLVAAEGGSGRLGALALGAGVASAVSWFAAIAFFVGPAVTVNDTSKFHLDPNMYRLMNDTGYLFWVGAVVIAALVVWATSAVALRTGLLPRWFAWLGIVVGILQLFAIFFVPAFIYWGWLVVAALLLTWRPAGWRTPAGTPVP
jgi:hypothetical protein